MRLAMELRGASRNPRMFANSSVCQLRCQMSVFPGSREGALEQQTGAGLTTHQGALPDENQNLQFGHVNWQFGQVNLSLWGKVRRFQPMSPDRVWVL